MFAKKKEKKKRTQTEIHIGCKKPTDTWSNCREITANLIYSLSRTVTWYLKPLQHKRSLDNPAVVSDICIYFSPTRFSKQAFIRAPAEWYQPPFTVIKQSSPGGQGRCWCTIPSYISSRKYNSAFHGENKHHCELTGRYLCSVSARMQNQNNNLTSLWNESQTLRAVWI